MAGNNSKTFASNVLFFEFENASGVVGIVNKFVNIKYSVPANKVELNEGSLVLRGTQYEPFTLDWGYYTDQTTNRSISVIWSIRKPILNGYVYQDVATMIGNKGASAE